MASSTAFVDAQIGIDADRHFRRNRRMIKTRIAVMALALSFMAAGACFAANPHMGTWKLNEAKSKLAPGMGKNNTVVYAEMKDYDFYTRFGHGDMKKFVQDYSQRVQTSPAAAVLDAATSTKQR